MKLKRLVLQGFKSFKDRTIIHFDQGITGIVGPNGCGKSNVVDALFWVMGEQSAKHLRGTSMKDVIFSGTTKYGPASWAEVMLVLENTTGKHIHMGQKVAAPSEIQLSRRLYRNGDTEYRINDMPCRLKDIQEVFMDTGAGAKSYSIIAQGEINRLVQAKPEERRTMIEEVAGITKFKIRKRDSLKKIEQTNLNLNRLTDLKNEIEKSLRILEKQAEKAERARNLKDKVKKYELVVESHKTYDLLKDFREGRQALIERKSKVQAWSSRKEQLELGLEEERFLKDEQTSKIEILQSEFNKLSKELAASEERLNSSTRALTDREKQIDLRQSESRDIKSELANRSSRLEQLKLDREQLVDSKNEDHSFEDLEDRVETLKSELEIKESSFRDVEDEIKDLSQSLQEIEQLIFRNTSRMEEFTANLHDIDQEIEALEKQYSGVNTEIIEEREIVKKLELQVETLKKEEQSLKENFLVKKENSYKLENDLKEKSKELLKYESKLASLKEIQNSLEGLKDGAKEFLGESPEGYGLFRDLFKCDDRYSKAVQTLLADVMEALISTTGPDQLLSWIKEHPLQGIDFLSSGNSLSHSSSIEEETIERLKVNGLNGIIPLGDILQVSEDYKEICSSLIKGMYIVESASIEDLQAISCDIRFKALTTLDGSLSLRNLSGAKILSVVDPSKSSGAIERNNRIDQLSGQLELLQVEVSELEKNHKIALEDYKKLEKDLAECTTSLMSSKEIWITKKSAFDAKLANIGQGNSRLEILKNRKSEISKQRLTLLEGEETLSNKQETFKENLETKKSIREELFDSLETIRSTYQQEREDLTQKQIEARSFGDRLKTLDSQIHDVEGQIQRQEQKLEFNVNLAEQLQREIETINQEIQNLEDSNHNISSTLSDKELSLSDLKDKFSELLLSMQSREEEVKELNRQINKNEKEIVEFEIKMGQALNEEAQIVRNIFEKYKVDLRRVVGTHLNYIEEEYLELKDLASMYIQEGPEGVTPIEIQDYEFNRRYGQDLRDCQIKLKDYKNEFSKLGEINWQAIEDYERQKLRYDFLAVQEFELKKSLEDLQKAIAHIDEKSRERFKLAFEEVNVRFQKVFPIIFGGGSAELKVTGHLDDPECGVDILASPPGKKMQNINLMSGGEKALTAVSLIFSIFLVKPSPFCLLDEVDAPLDDANVGRFNELLREMGQDTQFILITHNKKTMELNDTLYGVTMQEPGVSKAVSVQLH